MELIRDLAALPPQFRGGAVAIGNFDGVHLGHQKIVGRLLAMARRLDGPAVVFTFDPHPVRLLRPEQAPPPLTWTERKAELLGALGVDATVAYPTDEALLSLSPAEFFDRIIQQQLAARAMVEGPNFYFGRNRAGDVELLARLTRAADIELEVVQPVSDAQGPVSSSRIRQAIAAGEVADAGRMLGGPYRLRGMVTHGAKRGLKLGFPTANLEAIDTLVPAEGVYAGRGFLQGRPHAAAIHIGTNPTFEPAHAAIKVEVHLIDAQAELYGAPLEVEFLDRLRDNRTFASVEELKQQLSQDIADARRIGGESPRD